MEILLFFGVPILRHFTVMMQLFDKTSYFQMFCSAKATCTCILGQKIAFIFICTGKLIEFLTNNLLCSANDALNNWALIIT